MAARRWRLAMAVVGFWLPGVCALAAAPVSAVLIEEAEGFSDPGTAAGYATLLGVALSAYGEYLGVVPLSLDGLPVPPDDISLGAITHRLHVAVDEAPGEVVLRLKLVMAGQAPSTHEFAGAPDRLDLVYALAIEWLAVELGCEEAQLSLLRRWLPTAFPRDLDEWGPPAPADDADAVAAPTREYGLALVDALPSDRLQRLSEVFPGHAGVRIGDPPADAETRSRIADDFAEACAEQETDADLRATSAELLRTEAEATAPLLLRVSPADAFFSGMAAELRGRGLTADTPELVPILERGLRDVEDSVRRRFGTFVAPDLPPLEDDPRALALMELLPDDAAEAESVLETLDLPPGARALAGAMLDWQRALLEMTGAEATEGVWSETPLARVLFGSAEGAAGYEKAARDCAAVDVSALTAAERAGFRCYECMVLTNCGRYEDALASVRDGLAADRNAKLLWSRGWGLHLMRGSSSDALGAARKALASMIDEDERAYWRAEIDALEARTLRGIPSPFDTSFWDDDCVWLGASLGDLCVVRPPSGGDARGTVRLWCWSNGDEAVEFDAARRVHLATGDGEVHEASPVDPVLAPGADSEDGYAEVVLRFPTAKGAPSRVLLDTESSEEAPGETLSIPYRPAGGFTITGYADEE